MRDDLFYQNNIGKVFPAGVALEDNVLMGDVSTFLDKAVFEGCAFYLPNMRVLHDSNLRFYGVRLFALTDESIFKAAFWLMWPVGGGKPIMQTEESVDTRLATRVMAADHWVAVLQPKYLATRDKLVEWPREQVMLFLISMLQDALGTESVVTRRSDVDLERNAQGQIIQVVWEYEYMFMEDASAICVSPEHGFERVSESMERVSELCETDQRPTMPHELNVFGEDKGTPWRQ